MTWLDDIKGWFSVVRNTIDQVHRGVNKAWEWTINHVYLLAVPVLAALKSAWDLAKQLGDMVIDKIGSVDLASKSQSGLFRSSGLMDYLEFANSMVPLVELFAWAVFIFLFWGVCLLIRTIKGIKQTIAF